jgi:hypothetical protein
MPAFNASADCPPGTEAKYGACIHASNASADCPPGTEAKYGFCVHASNASADCMAGADARFGVCVPMLPETHANPLLSILRDARLSGILSDAWLAPRELHAVAAKLAQDAHEAKLSIHDGLLSCMSEARTRDDRAACRAEALHAADAFHDGLARDAADAVAALAAAVKAPSPP